MASKKIPSVEDALNIFKDVMRRASLTNYVYVNNILLSKNPKDQSILIIPEQELWNKIIDDTELKPNIRELDISSPADESLKLLFTYGEDLENIGWIPIDPQVIYDGKVQKIDIDNFEYQIPINKGLIPLKLKKAEVNNISYRVFLSPDVVMGIKKKFDPVVPDTAFTIIRLWKVL